MKNKSISLESGNYAKCNKRIFITLIFNVII